MRIGCVSGQWAWMGGGVKVDQSGIYGELGKAAATNIPGARLLAASWMDASGNLWLFGGQGYDSTAKSGEFGDLWEYQP